MKVNNVIALIGVIIAALTLVYIIVGDEKNESSMPSNNIQSTTGNNSPVINGVEGNVTIKK